MCSPVFSSRMLRSGSVSRFGVECYAPPKRCGSFSAANLRLSQLPLDDNVAVACRAGFIGRCLGSVFTGVGCIAIAHATSTWRVGFNRLEITNGNYCCQEQQCKRQSDMLHNILLICNGRCGEGGKVFHRDDIAAVASDISTDKYHQLRRAIQTRFYCRSDSF